MNVFAQALSQAVGQCIAAKTVSSEGEPVGFLYREEAVFENDSGWRFFSGSESDEYTADTANFAVVPLADIVKANPAVQPLMGEARGAWEIGADGVFYPAADWDPQD